MARIRYSRFKSKGIVPTFCEQIFQVMGQNTNPEKTFQVKVSMLEIYKEKVQDLLIPLGQRPQGGLKVREDKMYGVYVDNLSKHPVDSYEQIQQIMDDGNSNRSIAATQMNASSSRFAFA